MKPDALAAPPLAQPRPQVTHHHGRERRDDYAWLRAENWQEVMQAPETLSPEIRAHLEAENAWTEAAMAATAGLQAQLFAEMKGRLKEDDASVPSADGPWEYGRKYVHGGQHPVFFRVRRGGGDELVLLDGNALADGKAYYALHGISHSPGHDLLAYVADDKGSEFDSLRIRDLANGHDLPDVLTEIEGEPVWSPDGQTLIYTKLDAHRRPTAIFAHRLGAAQADDVCLFRNDDPGAFTRVGETQDRRFVLISSGDHQSSEFHTVPAGHFPAAPRLVAPRETEVEYEVEHHEGRLVILTNAGGAEDFEIVTAPETAPGRENWVPLVPHVPGRLIVSMSVFARHMVRLERENGLPRIVIRRWADGAEHSIAFDEAAYSLGIAGAYEFDTDSLRFSYSSMTTPAQVFDYDMETRQRTLRKTQEVPSGHDPANYETVRILAPAEDGETVPVSLLMRRGTPRDGSAPCLLYGYGSYGMTIPASFSTTALSLVDRGFVYAIAGIRGGKDKGAAWYKTTRGPGKTKTFTDFIAAGQHLAREGYTAEGRIVAQGGSAGGMLMGAVANMAPGLFAGIVAQVPFVDVLATMLDDTLPLTPPEWPEWGNPIADPAAYDTIAAYSPYDNVRAQDYPAILAMTGLTDPRVTYWEPAKWVARLRATKTDGNPLLLHTNMAAGHGGASGRYDRLKETALAFAFACLVTGRA